MPAPHSLKRLVDALASATDTPEPPPQPVLFDAEHYRRQLGLIGAEAPADAWRHYRAAGWRAGLSPHPLFDAAAYLAAAPDVAAADMDPLEHYLTSGWREGRQGPPMFDPDFYLAQPGAPEAAEIHPLEHYLAQGWRRGLDPGPAFSTQAYLSAYADLIPAGMCPLVHFALHGRRLGLSPSPSRDGRRRVLFVAHSAASARFGGERSFLDLIAAVDRERFAIIAALPDPDPGYAAAVAECADLVASGPALEWEEAGRGAWFSLTTDLIRAHRPALVYVNTLVPREAMAAARASGAPVACHIRELLTKDPELAESVGASPEALLAEVQQNADLIVANSARTAELFPPGARVEVLSNMVDPARFDLPAGYAGGAFTAALISSNVAKKGIEDVLLLAQAASERAPHLRFALVGPRTPELDAVMQRASALALGNIAAPGYAERAEDAIAGAHAVLVFSKFAESFGRTALEAMAARRPVIAYDRGALREVIGEEAGFLIPPDEPLAALPLLERLSADPELYARLGEAGRRRALEHYAPGPFARRLNEILDRALEGAAAD